jgi:hypothetical protein
MENNFVSLAVPPEMRERFLKGCEHYGFKIVAKKRSDYIKVFYTPENVESLYWLGANMYGEIQETTLTKRSF